MAAPYFRYELFRRARANGSSYYSVRFFDAEGNVFLTKSTGKSSKSEASAIVAQFIKELPLATMANAKRQGFQAEMEEAEALRNRSFATYVLDFWGADSLYLAINVGGHDNSPVGSW